MTTVSKPTPLIVGVGASAGGLAAIRQLLRGVSPSSGLAIIVVEHLDPKRPSLLAEVLRGHTQLTVVEASNGVTIEPDHVYVIPPAANLAVTDGTLTVSPREAAPRRSIDFLFDSLASALGRRAIGIVLSGTGTDGTEGLGAIKAAGGTTFAERPEDAEHPGMPESAIAAGVVDAILAPAEIGAEISRLAQHPYLLSDEDPALQISPENVFKAILTRLQRATGIDFAGYRPTTICRRIARRMMIRRVDTPEAYLGVLGEDPAELKLLGEDVLIHVTGFFRDPDAFEALKRDVFPVILQNKTPEAPIRVWVPGCSSGEEAYAIAIALVEFLGDASGRTVQLFGTDVSGRAIERARAGLYSAEAVQHLGATRLERFFVKEGDKYRIKKRIRELCLFTRHDVTRDPPFIRLDLVSCRNLFIYFGQDTQAHVASIFHHALLQPGFLLLGRSETLAGSEHLFTLIDKVHKIYGKQPASRPSRIRFGRNAMESVIEAGRAFAATHTKEIDLQRELERVLVTRYAPPAVLVTKTGDILQVSGHTGAFLEFPPGQPERSLLKMARREIAADLRLVLYQATSENRPARREGIRVPVNGQTRTVHLEAVPLAGPAGERHVVITFEQEAAPPEQIARPEQGAPALPDELSVIREHLRAIIEERDTVVAEAAAANEELLSSNEELQSTNEELDTAKEELESANEELTTMNDELSARNQDLNQLNSDLVNVFQIVNIPIVIVSRDRRIRRFFAPKAYDAFNLLPSDVDRPISDIRSKLQVPDLDDWLRGVIDSAVPKTAEVQDSAGRWRRLQIHPYVSSAGELEGALISVIDIDELRTSLEDAQRSDALKAAILDSALDAIITIDHTGQIREFNRAAEKTFGFARGDAIGRDMAELIVPLALRDSHRRGLARGDGPMLGKVTQLSALRADGSEFPAEIAVSRVAGTEPPLFTGHVQDITDRKRTEDAMRFLTDASALLVSSLDYRITLEGIARLAVPRIGDACAIDVFEGDELVQVASHHADPTLLEVAREARRRYPPRRNDPCGVYAVARAREAQLVEEVSEATLAGIAQDADHLRILRLLALTSVMFVPLEVHGQVLGVLSLAYARSRRHYTAADLELAIELSRRIAISIENARLYRTQAELAAIVECSYDAIIGLSLDGTIVSWNHGAEQLYGYRPEEVIGRPILTIVPDDRAVEEKRIFQSIVHGVRVPMYDTVRRHKDGRAVHVALSISPIRDAAGQVVGASKIARDIEWRRRAEQERERLHGELQAAIAARDVFLSSAAHELKTPINTLKLQTQLMELLAAKHELPEASLTARLASIDRQADHLTRLVSQLLDVSLLAGGTLRLDREHVNLTELARVGVARFEDEATRQGCAVSIQSADGVVGFWDRMRLDQVLTNLVSNALKFGVGKPIEIAIQSDRSWASLSVTDHGIGIATDDLDRIFQRFERIVSVRHYGGFGLGLWISAEIVKAHGGRIRADSHPGQGATFTVELPLGRALPEDETR